MKDKREPWRPTLSSNVSSVHTGVNKPAEAIREAAQHAFNAGSFHSNTSSTPKPISSGARSAAAAAGSIRKPALTASQGQNVTSTTTASSAVAAYARGRAPPRVERQPGSLGQLLGPVLSPNVPLYTRVGTSPPSQAQQAARMASKSRSPAGRKTYSPSPQDKASMPQDQSALLAGKLASLRSQRETLGVSSSNSQTGTPPVEQPSLNLKQIPYLPRKLPAQVLLDNSTGKFAGAAAAQAAAKHAQQHSLPTTPRVDSGEYFPFLTEESLSPDRSTLGGSLEASSAKSIYMSPIESPQGSVLNDTTKSAIEPQKPTPIPIGQAPRRSPGAISGAHSTEYRSGLTERSLADAIVAGSLASSRAPSPTKLDASLTSSRRSRSHSHTSLTHLPHHFLHHEKASDSQTKSSHAAPRSLKHTLRKYSDQPEDDEEEVTKRGRKHFVRKHPNKHHEGDRKRWRDKVTDRERRRYEGVWAANRGLFTFWEEEEPAFGESWKRGAEYDLVVNVVVRDIWERSRLPKDVLEEIWDLVATSEDAQVLQRDQFVVGLWLIDQRLKGRKLPVRVSSDVWNSVRHTQGVKISRKRL